MIRYKPFLKKHGILYIMLYMKGKRPIKQALSSPILLSSFGTPGTKTKRLVSYYSGMELLLFLRVFRKLLLGAVEGLHSTGLRSFHFVNNLSPVVCVMGRIKSFIDSAILS